MSFNKYKLSLVNYFLKQEKYNIYKSNKQQHNNNVYLYKINIKEFQIIKIVDNFSDEFNKFIINDEIVQTLKIFLNKKFKLIKFTILSIVLIENRSQIYKDNNGDVTLFVDKNNYIDRLSVYYPNIKMLEKNNENDTLIAAITNEEILDGIKNPNSKLTKKLKELSDKLNINNLCVTWILISLLLVIPIVGIFFGIQIFNIKGLNEEAPQLVYGGLTRDLLIWNNQWWRLWTYVLYSSNPLLIILNLFMIFNVSRYAEALLGRWRLSAILLIGVPLAGVFLSAVLPNLIFGGSTILLSILWGGLFSFNYGKEDLGSLIANQRTLIIVFWLLVMPFFWGYSFYLINFVGFFVGSALGYGLEFNQSHRIDWTILYSFFIIITMVTVSIVALAWMRYVPPYNGAVIDTLFSYWRADGLELIKLSAIEDMLNNYYFYPKVNWPIFLLLN